AIDSIGFASTVGETFKAIKSTLTGQRYWFSCFAAGTPLRTPAGSKPIEQFRVGDAILSRNENDVIGAVTVKRVEEVFVRLAPVLNLHIGDQIIRTTAEHPFFVEGRGWQPASSLRRGDRLSTEAGDWIPTQAVTDSGDVITVFNLRVGDFHTYFVGGEN